MDLIFSKNRFFKDNVKISKKFKTNNTPKLQIINLSLISHNYNKLTYFLEYFNHLEGQMYLTSSNLLHLYDNYYKVLRKTLLPWIYSVNLSNKINLQGINLILKPYSVRHRKVMKSYLRLSHSILIFYRWTSPYYRIKRIKRWLNKKYTNKLWR